MSTGFAVGFLLNSFYFIVSTIVLTVMYMCENHIKLCLLNAVSPL